MKAIALFCFSLFAVQLAQAETPVLAERVAARIKPHLMYPGLRHDGEVRFSVAIGVNGDVLDVKMTRSSGIPTYDAAVKAAILRSSPMGKLVRDDGSLVLDLDLVFNMKDVP